MENLSLFDYFVKCFKEYANFNGRARRREYWGFTLFWYIIYIVVYAAILLSAGDMKLMTGAAILGILFCLATIIPSLAVSVRRLHDVGKSGWFILISLIPIIGPIWLLVEFCTDSEPFENKYGANPKE